MKTLLVNLLIALSLGLCAFNAIQWSREAELRARLQNLGDEVYKKTAEIQTLQERLKLHADDIKRLDDRRTALESTEQSNRVALARLEEASGKLRRELQTQTAKAAQGEQYKTAFEQANANLKKQNEIISTLNERTKSLADERNQTVVQLNHLASEYKALGADYQKVLGLYTNLVAEVQAANERNAKR